MAGRIQLSLFVGLLIAGVTSMADVFSPKGIVRRMEMAAQWQLDNPPKFDPLEWHWVPFYMGLSDLSETTGDCKWVDEVRKMGDEHNWKFGRRPYHADDHAIGLSYVKLYG